MFEVFTNFLNSLIMSITGFYIIKKIIESKERLYNIKSIFFIFLLTVMSVLMHTAEYNMLYSIAVFALNIIIYKLIFKIRVEEALIVCGELMFLLLVSDIIIAFVMNIFINIEQIRNIWYIYLLSTTLVCMLGYMIVNLQTILKPLQKFYSNIANKKIISNILFIILLIIGLSSLVQNTGKTQFFNAEYFTNLIIMIIFICITYLFIKSKNNYNDLTTEYDSLFTYVQNFEEWIEKEQLNRHEYKNQLAILRCLTTEKKVKDKIDEILEDSINIEGEVVHQLKALPKGGVKGLMYYKATIAQKNKINLTVNVSLETKSILTRLSEKDIRILCKLIGIYFDNAIEAAKETRKKIVLIEIYELSDRVNMVFSNTFKKHDNFKDRNQKGVSSKGEGHGNGLYFAKKLIEANSWLEQKQEVIDKYYIQQISIKKKNTSKK